MPWNIRKSAGIRLQDHTWSRACRFVYSLCSCEPMLGSLSGCSDMKTGQKMACRETVVDSDILAIFGMSRILSSFLSHAESPGHEASAVPSRGRLIAVGEKAFDIVIFGLALL